MVHLFFGLVLFDQLFKRFVLTLGLSLPFGSLVKNQGIAFGFFSQKTSLIIVINVTILLGLIIFRKKLFLVEFMKLLARFPKFLKLEMLKNMTLSV